jgi:hypothetical protein
VVLTIATIFPNNYDAFWQISYVLIRQQSHGENILLCVWNYVIMVNHFYSDFIDHRKLEVFLEDERGISTRNNEYNSWEIV